MSPIGLFQYNIQTESLNYLLFTTLKNIFFLTTAMQSVWENKYNT